MSRQKSQPDLKALLDKVLIDFPPVKRTKADPVQFPRWFFEQGRSSVEIEAVALYSAMLAYGSAAQFIKKIEQTMQACNRNFLATITGDQAETFAWPAYRLSTAHEIGIFARAVGRVINRHKSIRHAFNEGFNLRQNLQDGLTSLQRAIIEEAEAIENPLPRGVRHLLPDPAAGGCAKRWHMFMRWMARPEDGVDMGLWPEVKPSQLLIPLDRHISRIARNLGLTTRASDDWKTAEEISAKLKEFSPEDPIKYDFSLCHLGIAGECTHGKDQNLCRRCLLYPACRAGKV
ncbi:MAG: TIGR02757 family protein [Candidatus Riflebacteria bacterium]|nr:TIGR02757 family protein [Candidatus Riflebacteria bacterium]